MPVITGMRLATRFQSICHFLIEALILIGPWWDLIKKKNSPWGKLGFSLSRADGVADGNEGLYSVAKKAEIDEIHMSHCSFINKTVTSPLTWAGVC